MSIYTKKGDSGTTAMFDSSGDQRQRVDKDTLQVEAIGCIDELDSFIGITKENTENVNYQKILNSIQRDLLTIGSILAGSGLRFPVTKTKYLEKLIDEWEGNLPVLKNFIVPGGTKISASLHYCRSLTRRAERRVVSLNKAKEVKPQVLQYLNRLSDFFFMFSRKVNWDMGIEDEVWKVK